MNKIILFLTILLTTIAAKADPYKDIPKNIQFVIPYGPGGIADFQYRHLEQYLIRKGINLTAIHKPGGNSTIAALEFSNAVKDGSVLMINSTSNSWLAEQRIGKKIIEPIISTGGTAQAMITYPGSKYENVDNFFRELKAGDVDIKIGWHSVATLLNLHQLTAKTNSPRPLFVPYKTSTDSSRDVSGKHIPLAQVPMSTAIPLVETGKVKIIFGFSGGTAGLPPGTFNIKNRYPSWRHDELFFIGLPPGVEDKAFKAWSAILNEYLSLKETEEAYSKVYFGKDVGGPIYVNEVIIRQSEALKKYNVEIK